MESRPQNPDLRPHVDPHRRTTKVNAAIVIGIIVFLVLTFFAVGFLERNGPETSGDTSSNAPSVP